MVLPSAWSTMTSFPVYKGVSILWHFLIGTGLGVMTESDRRWKSPEFCVTQFMESLYGEWSSFSSRLQPLLLTHDFLQLGKVSFRYFLFALDLPTYLSKWRYSNKDHTWWRSRSRPSNKTMIRIGVLKSICTQLIHDTMTNAHELQVKINKHTGTWWLHLMM